jgi:type IV fimbrial biogenesis protein FimT
MLNAPRRAPVRGFTIIELVVTLAIGAILTGLAMPALGSWLRNARIRAAAEMIQGGLRTAQSEAVSRSRQTAFLLTPTQVTPGLLTATTIPAPAANGGYWYVVLLTLLADDVPTYVTAGAAGDATQGVSVIGPATACFSSYGRMLTVSSSTLVTCPTAFTAIFGGTGLIYTIGAAADRQLSVTVATGGQVRMCDPKRTPPADADGC